MHLPITGIVSGGAIGPEWDSLVGAWELDGNDAASLLDASPAGLDLTDTGTPVPTQQTGKVGTHARGRSGAGSEYTANDAVFGVAHSFTVLGWVFPLGTPTVNVGMWANQSTSGTSAFAHQYWNNFWGRMHTPWIDASGTAQSLATITGTNDTWQFFMMKWDSAATTMSASLDNSTPVTNTSTSMRWNTNMEFNILKDKFGDGYSYLDAVRYFDRALSASEITSHYNSGGGLAYP